MATDPNLTTSGCTHKEAGFNFRRAFARHWRESLRRHGFWSTVKLEFEALYRVLRDQLPDRRKAKFGDLDYDWEHMVDTTRANVPFRMQLAAALTSGRPYFPSEPWLFEQILQALPIDFSQFTFIDLGSGKGRTLLMAASHGFRRVLGVEFIPELHRIAEKNIDRFISEQQVTQQIQSQCLDARNFNFPAEPLVLYFFNPFPESVFAKVLDKMHESHEKHPRPVFITYRYPEYEHLLLNCDWLEKVVGTEQWTIYRSIGLPP